LHFLKFLSLRGAAKGWGGLECLHKIGRIQSSREKLHSLSPQSNPIIAIIGAGPAGLMAAEVIASAGFSVSVYDAMPSVGRKFLLAGVGGMNITHSEPHAKLVSRYFDASSDLQPFLDQFTADNLRDWIHQLGVETFVGTSGRVFPKEMKAAPLLRAWLHRLRSMGVNIFTRHQWQGWAESGELIFVHNTADKASEQIFVNADACVLALGGASWPQLGSTGKWVDYFLQKNIGITKLLPANCGFNCDWSEKFSAEFSGQPLSTVSVGCYDAKGQFHSIRSEAVIANFGIEGTGVYALSSYLREKIVVEGSVELMIDLLPDFSLEKIMSLLSKDRQKNSMTNFLRKQLNLSPVKLALLRELTDKDLWSDTKKLSQAIKQLRLVCRSARPIDEAISSAGGVQLSELDSDLMLKKLSGVFCAGEMLDWEAPTGGYLLTACFATGRAAGLGVVKYLVSPAP
jgi:uncharacterized flavoprotein (TIGR03862 family)